MSAELMLQKLDEVLALVGLDRSALSAVDMPGADPVLATRYRVAEAGAVAIAASATAAAALWLRRGGERQRLEVPVLGAAAAMRSNHYLKIDGARPPRPTDEVTGFYQTGDSRWVYLHCNFPNLRDANARGLGAAPTKAELTAAVAARDGAAIEEAIFAAGGCGSLVRSEAEWLKLPQSAIVAAEPLIELIRIGDAPAESPPVGKRPLSGIRVLDLTRVLAGPTCGRTLAEHGADVLRVAKRGLPDSGMFDLDTGLGKLSTYLDLSEAEGAAKMRRLIAEADVFTQSYRPGSLAARGFGPHEVARLRPGIVYVTLDAWGFDGPWQDRRGYDTVVQGANGMAWNGDANRPKFQPCSVQDYVAGYLMAMGAIAGILRRATEGGSWLVRTSLAAAGHWVRGFGLVDPTDLTELGGDIPPDAMSGLLMESNSAVGQLTHLAPAARLSATPGHWARPAVSHGAHPPEWPARGNGTEPAA